jgi:excisionase family DNA binding protein
MENNLTFDQLPAEVVRLSRIVESMYHLLSQQNQSVEKQDHKLNVEEAAEFLGVTVPTIYSKKSKGELPACKAPGSKRLFFFKSDLVNYLKQGRQKTNLEIEAESHNYLKK